MNKKIVFLTIPIFIIVIGGLIALNSFKSQRLNIIYFDEEISTFVTQAIEDPTHKDQIWHDAVEAKYLKYTSEICDPREVDIANQVLFKAFYESPSTMTLYLDQNKNKLITKTLNEIYEKCETIVADGKRYKTYVAVFPTSKASYGVTPASNLIVLYLNPVAENESLIREIEGIFAHEYVHLMNYAQVLNVQSAEEGYNNSMFSDMILEGKACVFAEKLTGNASAKAYLPTKALEEVSYYKDIAYELYEPIGNMQYRVNGLTFSRSDVYYYGTKYIKEFLKDYPDMPLAKWLEMTPKQFKEMKPWF